MVCGIVVPILEKAMAPHSSVLAWRIPGAGDPGGLPSVGSHRVGHHWSDLAAAVPISGIELRPPMWKYQVLTTGNSPGCFNSQNMIPFLGTKERKPEVMTYLQLFLKPILKRPPEYYESPSVISFENIIFPCLCCCIQLLFVKQQKNELPV